MVHVQWEREPAAPSDRVWFFCVLAGSVVVLILMVAFAWAWANWDVLRYGRERQKSTDHERGGGRVQARPARPY